MIDAAQIRRVSDEIVGRFQPERIILIGFYAYGASTEDSDVDLLVCGTVRDTARGSLGLLL
jgi:predicted nucleotidyltransferase